MECNLHWQASAARRHEIIIANVCRTAFKHLLQRVCHTTYNVHRHVVRLSTATSRYFAFDGHMQGQHVAERPQLKCSPGLCMQPLWSSKVRLHGLAESRVYQRMMLRIMQPAAISLTRSLVLGARGKIFQRRSVSSPACKLVSWGIASMKSTHHISFAAGTATKTRTIHRTACNIGPLKGKAHLRLRRWSGHLARLPGTARAWCGP